MRKTITLIFIILATVQVKAQLIKEKTLDVSIGYGLSAPYYDDGDILDTGLYLQGEYVLVISKWIDIRPYAGLIFTKSNGKDINDNPTIYESNSNAFLIGGKTRVSIPIPWVSPYIEIGVGASIGSFKTFTSYTNIDKNGLILHIPFSLGLELGPKHNVGISVVYYFQPSVEQYAGAAAFGLSIPLN
ncbi:MAG: hypothetical protein K9I95_02930 [Flavobacteriaceae bacterium]|nr:hypothetical protein [Flavobacteriaceae bacterium]